MYEPAFHPDVEKDLRGLDKPTRRRILAKISLLLEHADVVRHEPLTAKWAGLYKLRAGDYRVVYEVDHEGRRIIIHAVGHRREIYKLR
jgi:mRNA interferase RelE/StbE